MTFATQTLVLVFVCIPLGGSLLANQMISLLQGYEMIKITL